MGHNPHVSHVLDLASRSLWQVTGRRIDLDGDEWWLDAPISSSARIGPEWIGTEAARHGGVLGEHDPEAGLLPSLSVLDGPGFAADQVHPMVRDLYEHTAAWQMDVWSGWSPVFWPVGELISRWWSRRVEQLALPMRPLDVAHGMDSSVTPVRDQEGVHVASAWTRTLRASGRTVFSGAYSSRTLPGADRPSVHVAFPLESGNLQVFLRPSATDGGGLLLESLRGGFGDDGAYVVVRGARAHAARVPLHETFHTYVDPHGVMRTDHELRVWGASALRLHYKFERAS